MPIYRHCNALRLHSHGAPHVGASLHRPLHLEHGPHVPKDGVVDVASLIGTRVVLCKTGNAFPKGSRVIVIRLKIMVPRVMDEPRIGEVHL